MLSAWSERKKAMEELGRGRELTNELRDLLSKSLGGEGLVGSEDLVMKIFNSFSNTLSILRNSEDNDDENPRNNNISWDNRKSEDLTQNDRRGCYTTRYIILT